MYKYDKYEYDFMKYDLTKMILSNLYIAVLIVYNEGTIYCKSSIFKSEKGMKCLTPKYVRKLIHQLILCIID